MLVCLAVMDLSLGVWSFDKARKSGTAPKGLTTEISEAKTATNIAKYYFVNKLFIQRLQTKICSIYMLRNIIFLKLLYFRLIHRINQYL